MRRLGFFLLAAGLALPVAAAPTIRAVFVGIDQYQYSNRSQADAGFDDLSGAVRDALNVKAALGEATGVTFDPAVASDCQKANAASITLLNRCATKASILAAWDTVIRNSQPQDIVLLYFAGHGSRFLDERAMDQASRYNSTLMAHDARKPGAPERADIMDYEIRGIINGATSRGVRVVTIFDSCNSGTANRDGKSASRSAPLLRATNLTPREIPAQYGNLGAWRVHLAAAGDGQDATEVGGVGNRAGVFSTAIAKALKTMPGASFADIAARVVAEVTRSTEGRQVPHAEGALRASLGGEEIKVPTFAVVADGERLVMAGGGLLGITPGSRFALYAETTDALRAGSNAALATAIVASTANSRALLKLESGSVAALPGRMVARELDHDFGGAVLGLAVADPAAANAVAAISFVRSDPRAQFSLVRAGAAMELRNRAGLVLASLPGPDDSDFRARLAAALGKIARVEQWLAALKGGGQQLCLAVSNAPSAGYDPANCPPGGVPQRGLTLKYDQPIRLGVVNRASEPRQLYVLHIGPKYDVTIVLPAFGGVDPPVAAGGAVRDGVDIYPTNDGDQRLVALATNLALDVSVLEQSATDIVDADACLTAVARAFCQRADTSRSGRTGEVTGWSAMVVPARVMP